jgi:hypothetical protein
MLKTTQYWWEIKEELNEWVDAHCSWIGSFNIAKCQYFSNWYVDLTQNFDVVQKFKKIYLYIQIRLL